MGTEYRIQNSWRLCEDLDRAGAAAWDIVPWNKTVGTGTAIDLQTR